MKKAIWFTGVVVIVFMLVIGAYLIFFREKSSKMPEGTFVRMEMPNKVWEGSRGQNTHREMEGTWNAWQRSA